MGSPVLDLCKMLMEDSTECCGGVFARLCFAFSYVLVGLRLWEKRLFSLRCLRKTLSGFWPVVNGHEKSRLMAFRQSYLLQFYSRCKDLACFISIIISVAGSAGVANGSTCDSHIAAYMSVLIPVFALYGMTHAVMKGWFPLHLGMELLFITMTICSGARVVTVYLAGTEELFFRMAGLRTAIRACASVLYMDVSKSAIWNLMYALVSVFSIATWESHSYVFEVCVAELASWFALVAICAFVESFFGKCMRTTHQLQDAQHALQRLLAGYCDAVVELDSEMHICNPSPKLLHLLSPGASESPTTLEGSKFFKHLASQDDRQRFREFIDVSSGANAVSSSMPRALQVNLQRSSSSKQEMHVDLFHVSSSCFDGSISHLIGIREANEAGDLRSETSVGAANVETARGQHTHLRTTRHRTSMSSGNSSSSCSSPISSTRTFDNVGLDKIAYISFTLDVDSDVREYTCRFKKDDRTPSIPQLVAPSQHKEFMQWFQSFSNKIAYVRSSKPTKSNVYGPLHFSLPSLGGHRQREQLVAGSVQLDDGLSPRFAERAIDDKGKNESDDEHDVEDEEDKETRSNAEEAEQESDGAGWYEDGLLVRVRLSGISKMVLVSRPSHARPLMLPSVAEDQ